MSNIKLSAPKRRRGPRPDGDSSVPVPVTTNTGDPPAVDNWNYYTGDLVEDHVLVRHSGDMDLLYRMGFFGKGNLSRNKPEYNEGFWTVRTKRRRPGDTDEPYLRVVSKRQYLSHLSWKEQSLSGKATPWETEDLGKLKIKSKNKLFAHKSHEQLPTPSPADPDSDIRDALPVRTSPVRAERNMEDDSPMEGQSETAVQTEAGWESPQKKTTDWPSPKEEESDPWAIGDQTDGSDFWGVGSSPSTENANKKNNTDFWATSEDPNSNTKLSVSPSNKTNSDMVTKDLNHKQKATDVKEVSERSALGTLETTRSFQGDKGGPSSLQTKTTSQTDNKEGVTISASSAINAEQTENTDNIQEQRATNNQTKLPAPQICDIVNPNTAQSHPVSPSKQLEPVHSPAPPVTLDPQCQEEDPGGDLYVVADSEEDEGQEREDGEGCEEGYKWIPTQKLDPYPLQECLQLTYEEAFFLSYGLGCLVVLDERKNPLNLTEMWQIFSSRRKNFIQNYVAYHSLRSRGWVPKTGIKYGADFVIYHKGPPYYHGSYSVLVRTAAEPDLRDDIDPANPTLTWSGLMGMDRVTEQVAKEPLLLLVIRPRDLEEADLASPRCVRRFKVQEMLLQRWIPSKEREAAESPEWL